MNWQHLDLLRIEKISDATWAVKVRDTYQTTKRKKVAEDENMRLWAFYTTNTKKYVGYTIELCANNFKCQNFGHSMFVGLTEPKDAIKDFSLLYKDSSLRLLRFGQEDYYYFLALKITGSR